MKRDKRWNLIKRLVADGDVKTFNDIFEWLPPTNMAADLGIDLRRLTKLRSHPGEFKLDELNTIARFSDLTLRKIYLLVEADFLKKKEEIKKVKKSSPP